MKQLAIIIISFAFISCNADTKDAAKENDSTLVQQKPSALLNSNQKEILISELKNLQATFASKDKNKIKQVFRFPIADSVFDVYIDSMGSRLGEKSGGMVTEQVFIEHFDKIYNFWEPSMINELFRYIKIDSLKEKDELTYELSNKLQPCYKLYSLNINNDTVTVQYGAYRHSDFNNKTNTSGNEEDIDCVEASFIWEFKFDGKKLTFLRLMVAG